MSSLQRRRPAEAVGIRLSGELVWKPEPWSLWCDHHAHRDLLRLWLHQIAWFDNEIELVAADEPEFLDRFWDVVDVRADAFPDEAAEFRAAAQSMTSKVKGLFPATPVVRYYVDPEDPEHEDRPSAWQASDVLRRGLEEVRPAYEVRLPAPKHRVWSVGADLTMCWVYTVAHQHRDNYFTVPDPSDPYGLFETRHFRYEDYLSEVDPWLHDGGFEPGPDGDPFTWEWRFAGGPLGEYLARRSAPWMRPAFDRVMAAYDAQFEV